VGGFMIKRLLISVTGGGVLTWLTYLYSQIPSNGPTLFTVDLLPFILLSKAISKDNTGLGDIVFVGLLVMFYSVVIFVVWWVIEGLLNESKGRKK
jgi:hypothetical protein